MKVYNYKDSANISTRDGNLVIGEKYDYKEGAYVGECVFLADESDDKYYIWKFKWTIAPNESMDNQEFTCSELKGSNFYFSGMWRIEDYNSYMFSRRPLDLEKLKNFKS
jgi:hypothetical protein